MNQTSRGILILGSINTDYVIAGNRLPRPGETVVGGQFTEARGGKGANQAVAAARAGSLPVTMVGAVGQDAAGQAAVRALEEDGVQTRFIQRLTNSHSGVALILVGEGGENCISVASGANGLISSDQVARLPDQVFAESRVFLTNLEVPLEAVQSALRRAKSYDVKTVLNPAPADRAIVGQALRSVDILTPNETEASVLSGVEVTSDRTAEAAARQLQAMGPQTVIVTRGSAGCVLLDGDATLVHVPAKTVQAIDTTAAGDAFNGALVVALVEGRAVLDAVEWASRAAALSVTRMGAQPSLPTRREIESFCG